jgi:hypothetical protein
MYCRYGVPYFLRGGRSAETVMKHLLLAVLLVAAPAKADLWSYNCLPANVNCTGVGAPYDCCDGIGTGTCPVTETSGVVGPTRIRATDQGCWTFTSADPAPSTRSPLIAVDVASRACLNDDLTGTAITAVAADIHRCNDGVRPSIVNPENTCPIIGILFNYSCAPLDIGFYFFENTVGCAVGDICQVSVEGIDPRRQ